MITSVMKKCTRALSEPILLQVYTQFLEKDLLKEITLRLKTISKLSCLMFVTMPININTQSITSRSLEVSIQNQISLGKTMKLVVLVNGLAFQAALRMKESLDHSLNNLRQKM
jgi:hypothetical protein